MLSLCAVCRNCMKSFLNVLKTQNKIKYKAKRITLLVNAGVLLWVFEKCSNTESFLPAWPLFSTAFVNILRAAITFLAKFLKYPAHFQLRTHCKTNQHYIITHTWELNIKENSNSHFYFLFFVNLQSVIFWWRNNY